MKLAAVIGSPQRAAIIRASAAPDRWRPQVSAGELPRLRTRSADSSLRTATGCGDATSRGRGAPGRSTARRRATWSDGECNCREWRPGRGLHPSTPEGFDFSARLLELRWEIWFAPQARVQHEGGASIGRARVRWVVASHRGMYRYFCRRLPIPIRPPRRSVRGPSQRQDRRRHRRAGAVRAGSEAARL